MCPFCEYRNDSLFGWQNYVKYLEKPNFLRIIYFFLLSFFFSHWLNAT